MEENVRKGLPNARRDGVRYGFGDQRKPFEEPNGRPGRSEQAQKRLKKKNAGADQNEEFYVWGNEAAPVEVIPPPPERSPHIRSVRRRAKSVKALLSYLLRRPRHGQY